MSLPASRRRTVTEGWPSEEDVITNHNGRPRTRRVCALFWGGGQRQTPGWPSNWPREKHTHSQCPLTPLQNARGNISLPSCRHGMAWHGMATSARGKGATLAENERPSCATLTFRECLLCPWLERDVSFSASFEAGTPDQVASRAERHPGEVSTASQQRVESTKR